MRPPPPIRRLTPDDIAASAPSLACLLLDAVADGASVGFLADLAAPRAEAYWRGIAAATDGRVVLAADDAQGIAGVVLVLPYATEIQPHRAEIAKLIVHRRARRKGIATALLQAAEDSARGMGRTVLSLFTRAGSEGEPLYRARGWTRVGVIVADSLRPDGTLCDGAIYTKRLR
jgi:GNAT superfamily N-acetyltransferase